MKMLSMLVYYVTGEGHRQQKQQAACECSCAVFIAEGSEDN